MAPPSVPLGPVPMDVHAHLLGAAGLANTLTAPAHAVLGKDSIRIDMELKLPHAQIPLPPPLVIPVSTGGRRKAEKPVRRRAQRSQLSEIIGPPRHPEPVYFQSFDCVGIPDFLHAEECRRIVQAAEDQGFSIQRRDRVLNLQWTDIVDPLFAEAIWQQCGLEAFLEKLKVDGMVPCGLNDVIRIQKYTPGCLFGRHIDQPIKRLDGRMSKYSLRVYLNGSEADAFVGGFSTFHVPFRPEPVVFEPETGLALLYPQGELCTPQEEAQVVEGTKYVLRADILFRRVQAP